MPELEPPVKPHGSERRKHHKMIRIDPEIAELGLRVAEARGISRAEYFSTALRPIILHDLKSEGQRKGRKPA